VRERSASEAKRTNKLQKLYKGKAAVFLGFITKISRLKGVFYGN
jgi:hypothetical protein